MFSFLFYGLNNEPAQRGAVRVMIHGCSCKTNISLNPLEPFFCLIAQCCFTAFYIFK
jgi:hypothetical protein